jgi:hypothetical protein
VAGWKAEEDGLEELDSAGWAEDLGDGGHGLVSGFDRRCVLRISLDRCCCSSSGMFRMLMSSDADVPEDRSKTRKGTKQRGCKVQP